MYPKILNIALDNRSLRFNSHSMYAKSIMHFRIKLVLFLIYGKGTLKNVCNVQSNRKRGTPIYKRYGGLNRIMHSKGLKMTWNWGEQIYFYVIYFIRKKVLTVNVSFQVYSKHAKQMDNGLNGLRCNTCKSLVARRKRSNYYLVKFY